MRLSRLILAGLWLASVPAQAQDIEEEDLEVEIFFLPAETVTTATRHAQPLEESPSAVTVLTRDDIVASGARSLPEALRLVPNMDIHMFNALWYVVGVRGGTDLISDRVMLLVDGREMTLDFFGFPIWTVQHFSMDDIERIEVIRGPGSALYGANAYAGVVQVVTRKPAEGPRVFTSLRGGENGQAEITLRARESLGPLAISASAGLEREDLWTSRDDLAKEVIRARLTSSVKLRSDMRLRAEGSIYQTSGSFYSDTGNIDINSMTSGYGLARFDYSDLMVQAVYDRTRLDMDLGLDLYYPDLEMDLARLPQLVGHTDKLSLQIQHAVELFHNRITYGAEYVLASHHSLALDPSDHNEHRRALYLQDEVNISGIVNQLAESNINPLLLVLGLRFDHNSITDWELSPRASLVYTPAENHGFRLGYAHAFLKPSFIQTSLRFWLDDFNDFGIERLNMANPGLSNQTIDSLEFGYTGSFMDDRLVVHCDLAYNWYRHSIWWKYNPQELEYKQVGSLRIPNLDGPGLGFSNDPDGEDGHDLELQVIVRPTDHSRVFVTAGYRQLFSNQTGEFLDDEPSVNLVAGADLSTGPGWTLALRGYYKSSHLRNLTSPVSFLEPRIYVRVPQAFFLNARLAWKFAVAPWDLTIGLEGFNLLDNRVREHAGFNMPNGPDYGGERLSRRVVFFLTGQI